MPKETINITLDRLPMYGFLKQESTLNVLRDRKYKLDCLLCTLSEKQFDLNRGQMNGNQTHN